VGKQAETSAADLVARARDGEAAAVARLISRLEAGRDVPAISAALAGAPPPEQVIGLTGAPGVGKSTLASALVRELRAEGEPVAVVAVDPSSAFSGGALLGDRLRLAAHASDAGVFIRSLAGRGAGGGLSLAAADALRVLGAAGFGRVLLETAGAGQDEYAVADICDTVVLVNMPGTGDMAQDLKVGLSEFADVFATNKADQDEAGARAAAERIEQVLDAQACTCRLARAEVQSSKIKVQGPETPSTDLEPGTWNSAQPWRPPVLVVSAAQERGVDALAAAIGEHRAYLARTGLGARARARRLRRELVRRATRLFAAGLRERPEQVERLVAACRAGRMDIHAAARALVEQEEAEG
jgi:LAO/AO transport system kinase